MAMTWHPYGDRLPGSCMYKIDAGGQGCRHYRTVTDQRGHDPLHPYGDRLPVRRPEACGDNKTGCDNDT